MLYFQEIRKKTKNREINLNLAMKRKLYLTRSLGNLKDAIWMINHVRPGSEDSSLMVGCQGGPPRRDLGLEILQTIMNKDKNY